MPDSRPSKQTVTPFIRFAAILAGIMLAFAAIIGFAIVKMRSDALDAANYAAVQISKIVSQQVGHSAQAIDILIDDVSEWAMREQIESGSDFEPHMASQSVHLHLSERLNKLHQASAIALTNAQGKVIASTRIWPLPPINVADRDYFRNFVNSTRSDLFVSEPIANLVDGTNTVVFSKPRRGTDGSFLGTVFVAVTPEIFTRLENVFSVNEGRGVNLLRRDGLILSSFGDLKVRTHRMPPNASWWGVVANGGGTYRTNSVLDPRSSWVSTKPVENYPLVVNVVTLEESALAAWRVQAGALIAGTVAFELLLFVILLRLQGQYRATLVSEARFQITLEHLSHGLAMYDASGCLQLHNQKYEQIWGFNPKDLRKGMRLWEVLALQVRNKLIPEEQAAQHVKKHDVSHREASGETRSLADGRLIQISYDPLPDGGWITTHADITESSRASHAIAHMASHDDLTNLANRALFTTTLMQSIGQQEHACSVLLLDLDHFKEVNDGYGHSVGDELLRLVAARLQETVRAGDLVARLGGDEFAILHRQDDTDLGELTVLAQNLIETVRHPYDIDGRELLVGVSIGVAHLRPGEDLSTVLRHADLALYRAKSDGRNRFCIFMESLERELQDRRDLAADLKRTIAAGELTVHYQPIIGAKDHQIIGMEALVRWQHSTRGWISPAEFIPIAEESGLIEDLGHFVLRQACSDALSWPKEVVVSVNVSPIQVVQNTFFRNIASLLEEISLEPRRLKLEITESVLLSDSKRALDVMHDLRGLGVSIALDDFGTGFSSMSYLKQFPFDEVKIDRSFVADMASHAGCAAIISATTHLAKAFNMQVTAEGVETASQLELLTAASVDRLQGYLFGRPSPNEYWLARFKEGFSLRKGPSEAA